MKNKEDKKYRAVKITVTYDDGHTDDYDVFILAVATGLMPVDKIGNDIVYIPTDKFSTFGIACIKANTDVIVGLVRAINAIISNMVNSMDERGLLELMVSLGTLHGTESEKYSEVEHKIIHPEEN